jgi:hypothetical protein
MRNFRIAVAMALALSFAGCAQLSSITTAVSTVSQAQVPAKQIYIAVNAFDAVKITATNYIRACVNYNPLCVSRDAVTDIRTAIAKGTPARNSLKQFLRDHPGQFGDSGVYDALTSATATLTAIINQEGK